MSFIVRLIFALFVSILCCIYFFLGFATIDRQYQMKRFTYPGWILDSKTKEKSNFIKYFNQIFNIYVHHGLICKFLMYANSLNSDYSKKNYCSFFEYYLYRVIPLFTRLCLFIKFYFSVYRYSIECYLDISYLRL